jgi:hypothetical protein
VAPAGTGAGGSWMLTVEVTPAVTVSVPSSSGLPASEACGS